MCEACVWVAAWLDVPHNSNDFSLDVWELLVDGVVDSIEVHLLALRRQVHPILLDTHRLHNRQHAAMTRHVECAISLWGGQACVLALANLLLRQQTATAWDARWAS